VEVCSLLVDLPLEVVLEGLQTSDGRQQGAKVFSGEVGRGQACGEAPARTRAGGPSAPNKNILKFAIMDNHAKVLSITVKTKPSLWGMLYLFWM